MDVVKMIAPNPAVLMMGPPMMDVSGIKRKFLDIPYASQSPRQSLDIYLPDEGEGPFPTIIFIHGGGFLGGDKRDMQAAYVLNGIRRGYAVVSVEQRLSPETRFPYPLFDFKAAIRFLRAGSSKYMLDGNRFASAGDSAGGYFAVMAAATQDNPAFEDLCQGNAGYSSRVSAVVSWFGLFDLTAWVLGIAAMEKPDGMPPLPNFSEIFMGIPVAEHPGLMYFSNPLNFIAPNFPPILIQAGTADQIVPFGQSAALAETVSRVCGAERVEFDSFAGCAHGDPAFSTPENEDRIFAFLDKYMKQSS